MNKPSPSGFTLVELAIVMTIIGILIGGVLKGEKLIENARIKATIKNWQEMTAATTAFRDKYGQLPGDMSTAQTRLPGCGGESAAGNWCVSGDGNYRVGRAGTNRLYRVQAGAPFGDDAMETSQFWKHLALSDLITGVNPGADPLDPYFGGTHPASPWRGGYSVLYQGESEDGGNGLKGHYLRLQGKLSGAGRVFDEPENGTISPRLAEIIDRKVDDGKPEVGYVFSESTNSGCDSGPGSASVYRPSDKANCTMFFKMH